jgi:FLVCR family MFS transporter 7
MIINGSFQTFTTAANFILKPYGYTDIQITICAILLIIFGVIGAILASLYIKKTGAYKRVITITTIGVCLSLLGAFISLAFIKIVAIISIMFVLIGFFLTPIVPITYQIGC